jgi:phosphatidylglycerol:prolipoprotein diacylglycerol transferase
MSDMAAVALPAAYAIGRSGCWAVGDDYGKPWNGPFAVSFPEGAPPSTVANMQSAFGVQFPPGTPLDQVVSVHPTQLYEVLMGAIMFFIILRVRKQPHREGWLFGLYCLLAGIERIIVEFFRAKDDRFFGAMTLAQMIGLGFAMFGIAWMAARWKPVPASA